MRVYINAFIFVLTALLCACGGGGTTTGHVPPCGPNAITPSTLLLYPVDGATNVPDGNFNIVMSSSLGIESLAPANGGATVPITGSFGIPSPMPSPLPTLEPGTSGYYVLAVPALQSKTKYTLWASFPNGIDVACTPSTEKIGSFTTQ